METEYGKIAPAICADADYPGFVRQAGKNNVDIMFIPANDWKAIDTIHPQMVVSRAIENGFSLVHPAGPGLSIAKDNFGNAISSMDCYCTDEQIMFADVPTHRTPTLYAIAGNWFAWICMAALYSKAEELYKLTLQWTSVFKGCAIATRWQTILSFSGYSPFLSFAAPFPASPFF